MHKYNNQDHSMLTAMVAVDNIITGQKAKDAIWEVNTEIEYHESKRSNSPAGAPGHAPQIEPAVAKPAAARTAAAGSSNS
jgi:hypothetical protein